MAIDFITTGSVKCFTIPAKNNSTTVTSSNTVVQVSIPAGISYNSWTPSTGTFDSGTGIWTIGNLAPGATQTLNMCIRVNEDCITPIMISWVIDSDQCDGEATNNTSSHIIDGATCCDLNQCLGQVGATVITSDGNSVAVTQPAPSTYNVEVEHVVNNDGTITLNNGVIVPAQLDCAGVAACFGGLFSNSITITGNFQAGFQLETTVINVGTPVTDVFTPAFGTVAVSLTNPPLASQHVIVHRNGSRVDPATYNIVGSVITFDDPFGNSGNGAGLETITIDYFF